MPFYCFNCDDFFYYERVKAGGNICPQCKDEMYFYKNIKKVPVGFRCKHCKYVGTNGCPDDIVATSNDAIYHKPCDIFSIRKGVKVRR